MAIVGDRARHRRSIDRRLKELKEALYVLDTVDEDWLWEMQRRREATAAPDGYSGDTGFDRLHGASTSIHHVDGCPDMDKANPNCECGPVPMTSVERTASLSRPGCRQPLFIKLDGIKTQYCARCGRKKSDHTADPIGNNVEEVFDLIDRATMALRTLKRKGDVILLAADGHRGRMSSIGDCLACGRPWPGVGDDRLRSGYGPCCYEAFRTYAGQCDYDGVDRSHVVFRIQRKAELDAKAAKEAEKMSA